MAKTKEFNHYKLCLEWTQNHNKTLKATDFQYNKFVKIDLSDGSSFTWNSAFLITHKKWDYVSVFTEHYGCHVFAKDEIVEYYFLISTAADCDGGV